MKRPNPETVLDGLKDFQRRTVDYVFDRLYIDDDHIQRFLIADEVGLGKTLVARGIIARTLHYLWDDVSRIDVVYICSNADIARQNIDRLSLPDLNHPPMASRITLLPVTIDRLHENKVNFISFTPNTSFSLRSALGIGYERALLYWLLDAAWGLSGTGPLNLLQGDMSKDNFRNLVKEFPRKCINTELSDAFVSALAEAGSKQHADGEQTYRQRFDDLCNRFGYARKHIPARDRSDQVDLISELRALLARTCIGALQPDLIILDEFQRFKFLLDEEKEAGELATLLFNYEEETGHGARTLLLSATPYKMYTLSDETDEDDHYQDFLDTLRFLFDDAQRLAQFEAALHTYRRALFRLDQPTDQAFDALQRAKTTVEQTLQKVMARTERLTATTDRNGMLRQIPFPQPTLASTDLLAYAGLDALCHWIEHHSPLEYWKSAPYVLNFMERHYRLKQLFVDRLRHNGQDETVAALLRDYPQAFLDAQSIEQYGHIDPANAQLRTLIADTLDSGAWRLLWIPAALPYYRPEDPFSEPAVAQFTKRLIFSAWHVVPKAISVMLSYEAERRMLAAFDNEASYDSDARSSRGGRLQFTHGKDERLTGMPVLAMIYPSLLLARVGDPKAYVAQNLTLEQVRHKVRQQLKPWLSQLNIPPDEGGTADEAWYWVAPILLDMAFDAQATAFWWNRESLTQEWTGEADGPSGGDTSVSDDSTVWREHVSLAREVLNGYRPDQHAPSDLLDVLTDLAIGGSAVVALRSLARVNRGFDRLGDPSLRMQAASVGWAFRSLFNVPEVTALLQGLNREVPYWRQVLAYSAAGNLQAVLDEYAHVLREALGLFDDTKPEDVDAKLATAMRAAIQLRQAPLKIDGYNVSEGGITITDRRLRTHFALRFGDQSSDDGQKQMRKQQVREAFNSPFWPFVLATTSVGQEGLDFHLYCHAIVHWNLPPNPVDLEQREGRIHRYKGHAVRKNIAARWRSILNTGIEGDLWQFLFVNAKKERDQGHSDIIPFWIYPENGDGIAAIERHVLALPLSRDRQRLEALRHSLTVYRMAFGQNRQEDLVSFLLERLPDDKMEVMAANLQINLEPPPRATDA